MLIDTILSGMGGGGMVALALYFLMKENTSGINLNKATLKDHDSRIESLSDCLDSEVGKLKDGQDVIVQNSNALIQYLISTQAKDYPEAVAALQQVLRQSKGGS